MPEDPTKEPGRVMGVDGGYGSRSQFESEVRWFNPTRRRHPWLPMQNSYGNDHAVRAALRAASRRHPESSIRPEHRLVIHGLVDRPIKYSLADLKRFPTISRTYFMECSGTTGGELMKATQPTVQRTHGLVSTSEWTGVPLSTLLKQTGLKPEASWVLAEGADGAVMTRSVPIDKCLSDALIVFGQNGEAIRPEQGYPMRLFLPGWEGQHLDQMAAPARGQRQAVLHPRRNLEIHRSDHQDRQGAHLHVHDGREIGHHFPVRRDEAARSRFLRDHGAGLVWARENCARGNLDGWRADLEPGRVARPVLPISQTRFRFPWIWTGAPRPSRAEPPTRPATRSPPTSN